MRIIGITGTNGAGKGEIVKILQEQGFIHLSVRGYIEDQLILDGVISERGEATRDQLHVKANQLRKQHEPHYIVMELYKIAKASEKNCVIESVRTMGEVDALKKLESFELWGVDADRELRYERCKGRDGEVKTGTMEQFIEREEREMQSTDPAIQNVAECLKRVDALFTNNGELTKLKEEVEKRLRRG